jgi:hypothetical protein
MKSALGRASHIDTDNVVTVYKGVYAWAYCVGLWQVDKVPARNKFLEKFFTAAIDEKKRHRNRWRFFT